ncbi:MAG: RecX family transcriptional regulator [Terracidiphilus sp.]
MGAPGPDFETWETASVSLQARSYKLPFPRKPATPRAPLTEAALYSYALKALGRHMRTEVELRRLMASRAEPGPSAASAISAVIARLKEHGYLNDAAFAETYARLRQENEKLGVRRVRQDLQQKGICSDLINETLEARYGATNEEALARQHLERKRIRKPENEKETARVMRRLVAAGFSTGVIYKILRQWNVPDESLAALDNLDTEDAAGGSHED